MSIKNVSLTALVILVFLYLIKFFDISYPLTIVNTAKSMELSVVGEGKVEVVPDTAEVNLSITFASVPTVEEAQKKIDVINNQIIAAMKNLGINKTEIKTSNYSIYPEYDYTERQNKITGYNANASVTIKVKDLQLTSQVIEAGTKAGANQVNATQFTIDKPENYREEARNKAIANAKEQAQKLASNLGIRLGKISNIVESTPANILPMQYKALSAAEGLGGGVSPQIEPGSQTISSIVTLYFEKK